MASYVGVSVVWEADIHRGHDAIIQRFRYADMSFCEGGNYLPRILESESLWQSWVKVGESVLRILEESTMRTIP